MNLLIINEDHAATDPQTPLEHADKIQTLQVQPREQETAESLVSVHGQTDFDIGLATGVLVELAKAIVEVAQVRRPFYYIPSVRLSCKDGRRSVCR